MIFTTSFFRNPYPDEKYSGTSLPTSQKGSNIQDDEATDLLEKLAESLYSFIVNTFC